MLALVCYISNYSVLNVFLLIRDFSVLLFIPHNNFSPVCCWFKNTKIFMKKYDKLLEYEKGYKTMFSNNYSHVMPYMVLNIFICITKCPDLTFVNTVRHPSFNIAIILKAWDIIHNDYSVLFKKEKLWAFNNNLLPFLRLDLLSRQKSRCNIATSIDKLQIRGGNNWTMWL